MNATWRTVRRSLIGLLKRPAIRRHFREMKEDLPALHRWQTPRQVASFLSRRTSRLDQRKDLLRTLLKIVGGRGPRAEVAAIILLLAGALAIDRLAHGSGGGSAPPLPFVLIIGHLSDCPSKEGPLAFNAPMLPAWDAAPRSLALAEVSR
jgi:hypothetical protein